MPLSVLATLPETVKQSALVGVSLQQSILASISLISVERWVQPLLQVAF